MGVFAASELLPAASSDAIGGTPTSIMCLALSMSSSISVRRDCGPPRLLFGVMSTMSRSAYDGIRQSASMAQSVRQRSQCLLVRKSRVSLPLAIR